MTLSHTNIPHLNYPEEWTNLTTGQYGVVVGSIGSGVKVLRFPPWFFHRQVTQLLSTYFLICQVGMLLIPGFPGWYKDQVYLYIYIII